MPSTWDWGLGLRLKIQELGFRVSDVRCGEWLSMILVAVHLEIGLSSPDLRLRIDGSGFKV
jgi:hypothetical protein